MSVTLSVQTIVGGLLSSAGSKSSVDDSAELASPDSVSAAQPGVLTTRSGNTSGTLTMTNSGHGIITGQRFDLYWEGGACFGVIAGTVSGTSIPFTRVQGGTVLPAALTAVIAGICKRVVFDVDGNGISALVCSHATAPVRSYFVFQNASNILALSILNQAGRVYVWDGLNTGFVGSSGMSDPSRNPLAGTSPVEVYVSHANTAAADTGLSAVALKH